MKLKDMKIGTKMYAGFFMVVLIFVLSAGYQISSVLRLGKMQDAASAFQTYLQKLEAIQDKSQSLMDEIIWTRKLIFKTKGIQN